MECMQVAFQNENIIEKNTPDVSRVVQNFGPVSYTHLTLPTTPYV